MSSYCVRFAATGLSGKSPPDFTCPFPLRGMGGEQCEMERGIHVFLAHPHLGGWVASGARRKGASVQRQMMVGAPLCLMAPFPLTEFLCPLRRHRPLGATPFHHFVVPLPPQAGGGKFLGTWFTSPPRKLKESKCLS